MLRLCLLLSISCTQGRLVCGRRAGNSPRLPQLLVIRGGVRPAAAAVANSTTPSPSSKPANASKISAQSRASTRQAKPQATPFVARDAVTAALGLAAAGAVQWCCNKNFMAKLMGFVPGHVRKPVWVVLSGTLAAILFLLVRITNPSRAIVINCVLSKLLLNRELESTLPSLVFVFVLGMLSAIQALPAYDLRLLWAMFSSLGLVVAAAVVKFGGKRPSFAELLDWASDSISSSPSSGPSSPVRR